jgi:Tol biopolymer transport system component
METRKILQFFVALIVLATLNVAAFAQIGLNFGQNKVHYKNFDWSILSTEHFDIYYYPEEAEAANDAARMAERGYDYLSEVLDHQFKEKIPVLLYASVNDFQQTNVVQGMIGDGTRGVTESMKNRVALPITGSYRDFNHVLVHELVHAFQFDIMFGPKTGVTGPRFNPPLWFVEGMAEYLSVGMDNITRMWVRDGLENDKLLTVDQLSTTYDIRVYRLGESLWYYIGERYGKRKVGDMLKAAVRLGGFELSLKEQLARDTKQLTEEWHKAMRELVYQEGVTLQKPEEIAEQITKQSGYYHRMNIVPAVSPDGKDVVYVANKNLKDDIFLLSRQDDGKYKTQRLVKGGESKGFENLRFFDTSINWSRDGSKIAFVSKAGKDDAIYVIDAKTKKVLHQLIFDELNGLSSPAFSPDGNRIVFVGISGGISDLYLLDLKDENLLRLTEDRYAVLHPQWSPDEKQIIFATDRGPGTDIDQLLFGDYDLALYSIQTGKIELITELDGNAINPQWIENDGGIAFVSDHQGIPNIYWLDLTTRDILAVTMLNNGVAGITESTPAFSASADGNVMVFSTFEKNVWQIYRMELPKGKPVLTINTNNRDAQQPDLPAGDIKNSENVVEDAAPLANYEKILPAVPEPNEFYSRYELADEDSISERDYATKLRLDAVSVGGAIGGYQGSVGLANFLFSDMLGNQNLILSTGLRFTNPLHSDLGATYINMGRRVNYGVQLYQTSDEFISFLASTAQGRTRRTYRGGNVFAVLPFSRFARLEVYGGFTYLLQDFLLDTFNGGRRERETTNLGKYKFGQIGAAYVYDNSTYGPIGPFSGSRYRFTVQQTTNDFQFTTFFADYRKYKNISQRSVLAYRLLGGYSTGRDAQIYSIGGPYTFRGTDFNGLYGSKFLVQNLEYRFPLLPFLPPGYDFLSGVAFFDLAGAWGEDIPGLVKETFQPFSSDGGFALNDLKGALGFGGRLNLGLVGLRLDIGWPTNLQNFGKPVTLFSIGADF